MFLSAFRRQKLREAVKFVSKFAALLIAYSAGFVEYAYLPLIDIEFFEKCKELL